MKLQTPKNKASKESVEQQNRKMRFPAIRQNQLGPFLHLTTDMYSIHREANSIKSPKNLICMQRSSKVFYLRILHNISILNLSIGHPGWVWVHPQLTPMKWVNNNLSINDDTWHVCIRFRIWLNNLTYTETFIQLTWYWNEIDRKQRFNFT